MRALHLPLLGREFVGAANRLSTYAIRVLLTLLALVLLLTVPMDEISSTARAPAGGTLLWYISLLLEGTILLFVPIDRVSRVFTERAEGTLQLLLVSGQGPWRLIAQWWLGAIGLSLSFVLAMTPIAALAYVFGGVTVADLLMALLNAAMLALLVAATAVEAGCVSRNVPAGLLRCYATAGLVWIAGEASPRIIYLLSGFFLPMTPLIMHAIVSGVEGALVWWRLSLARRAVRSGRALQVPIKLRRRYGEPSGLRDRWVPKRGWVGSSSVPTREPIRWREEHRRAYGSTVGDRTRLLFMCAPLGIAAIFPGHLWVPYAGLWITSTLILLSCCVAMPNERVSNTLETISTTPLGPRSIVRQKYRARAPFIRTALGCLAGLTAIHLSIESYNRPAYSSDDHPVAHAAMFLCCSAPLLIGAAWLGMWIGLKSRTALASMVRAAGTLVCFWLVAPIALSSTAESAPRLHAVAAFVWPPLFINARILDLDPHPFLLSTDVLPLLGHACLWSGLAWFARHRCLRWSLHAGRPLAA